MDAFESFHFVPVLLFAAYLWMWNSFFFFGLNAIDESRPALMRTQTAKRDKWRPPYLYMKFTTTDILSLRTTTTTTKPLKIHANFFFRRSKLRFCQTMIQIVK